MDLLAARSVGELEPEPEEVGGLCKDRTVGHVLGGQDPESLDAVISGGEPVHGPTLTNVQLSGIVGIGAVLDPRE